MRYESEMVVVADPESRRYVSRYVVRDNHTNSWTHVPMQRTREEADRIADEMNPY